MFDQNMVLATSSNILASQTSCDIMADATTSHGRTVVLFRFTTHPKGDVHRPSSMFIQKYAIIIFNKRSKRFIHDTFKIILILSKIHISEYLLRQFKPKLLKCHGQWPPLKTMSLSDSRFSVTTQASHGYQWLVDHPVDRLSCTVKDGFMYTLVNLCLWIILTILMHDSMTQYDQMC